MSEKDILELESVANFLRGMCFDPRLPQEHKNYVLDQVARIDLITQRHLE